MAKDQAGKDAQVQLSLCKILLIYKAPNSFICFVVVMQATILSTLSWGGYKQIILRVRTAF
jgi:hypothetical protein